MSIEAVPSLSRRLPRLYCRLALRIAAVLAVSLLYIWTEALAGSEYTIKMIDMPPSFQPSRLVINVGDTVRWENNGSSVHHATSNEAMAIKKVDASTPGGAPPFDSGFLPPGEQFKHTFTIAGTYKYVCLPHETAGMVGEIVVRDKSARADSGGVR